jgi:hypothetical protein
VAAAALAAAEEKDGVGEKPHHHTRVSHDEVVWSNEKAAAEAAVAIS